MSIKISQLMIADLETTLLSKSILRLLLSMTLGLLTIDKVQALSLGLAVDEGTDGTGEEFLGLCVVVDHTYIVTLSLDTSVAQGG